MRANIRVPIDGAMLVLMPLLMAYSLVGEGTHEWMGIALAILFMVHQILNIGWWKNIFRGKINRVRILMSVVNVLLLADMLLLVYSGIDLSEHIFPALPELGSSSISRVLHLVCAHWGIVLTSLHLGFHGRKIGGYFKSAKVKHTLFAVGGVIGIYGVGVFILRHIYSYLFPATSFIFFDAGTSLVRSLADYSALIVLFAYIGYFAMKMAANQSKNKRSYPS